MLGFVPQPSLHPTLAYGTFWTASKFQVDRFTSPDRFGEGVPTTLTNPTNRVNRREKDPSFQFGMTVSRGFA